MKSLKVQSKNVFIGNKIKSYRKKRKWTQLELAEKIGVKSNTISSYESGKIEIPHSKLQLIANVFDIKTFDLLPIEGTGKQDTISEYIQEAKSELDEEQLELFNELFKKTLSLEGNERANFLENVRFAIQFINKK